MPKQHNAQLNFENLFKESAELADSYRVAGECAAAGYNPPEISDEAIAEYLADLLEGADPPADVYELTDRRRDPAELLGEIRPFGLSEIEYMQAQKRRQEFKALRGKAWYKEGAARLVREYIHPAKIDPKSHFEKLLENGYRRYMRAISQGERPAVDAVILRCEYRQAVLAGNKRLRGVLSRAFPEKGYDYRHYYAASYTPTDKNILPQKTQPQDFINQSPQMIINTIGVQTLFGGSGREIVRKILQCRLQETVGDAFTDVTLKLDPKQVNRYNLLDLAPGHFLLGRIWSLRRMYQKLTGELDDETPPFSMTLPEVARYYESLNLLTRSAIRGGPLESFDAMTRLPGLFIANNTWSIKDYELLLSEYDCYLEEGGVPQPGSLVDQVFSAKRAR